MHSFANRICLWISASDDFAVDTVFVSDCVANFKEQEPKLLQMIRDFKFLKGKTRKTLEKYLQSYFDNYQFIQWPVYQLAVDKIGD